MNIFGSIRAKILVLQTGIVLFVFIILGSSAYWVMAHSLQKTQKKNLELIAQEKADDLNRTIADKINALKQIALG